MTDIDQLVREAMAAGEAAEAAFDAAQPPAAVYSDEQLDAVAAKASGRPLTAAQRDILAGLYAPTEEE